MNAPLSQKHHCCLQVQTKAPEMHTGSLSAAGGSYEVTLLGHCMQGVGLEIGTMNREATKALAQSKNFNVVNNTRGATTSFALNMVLVVNRVNKSMRGGLLANDKWRVVA